LTFPHLLNTFERSRSRFPGLTIVRRQWKEGRAWISSRAIRLLAVLGAAAVVAVAVSLYVDKFTHSPTPVAAIETGPAPAHLTLGTTPAIGDLGGNPAWVSYLAREDGEWKHTTEYELPAHSLVQITVYQFDSATGLRNPFLSQVQGTVGGVMKLNGKTTKTIEAEQTSHTFTVPQLGIVVPLPGVAEDAKNQCAEMPCSLEQAHQTVVFTIRTGEPGRYRWQCFVPCAAGFIEGFGGPMQTIGYMDGFLNVV
jgi:hypothetical protein